MRPPGPPPQAQPDAPLLRPAEPVRLHARLAAEPPAEHFAITGSHEALGKWSPSGGVPLDCRGGRWVTARPVPLASGGRVEFKFVRLRPEGAEWEDCPNRVLEAPMGDADVELSGKFNGDFMIRLVEPDKDSPAHEANAWRSRCDEAARVLAAHRRTMEAKREEHRLAQERRAALAAQLRSELAQARLEAEELSAEAEEAERAAEAEEAVAAAVPSIAAASGGRGFNGPSSSSTSSAFAQAAVGQSRNSSACHTVKEEHMAPKELRPAGIGTLEAAMGRSNGRLAGHTVRLDPFVTAEQPVARTGASEAAVSRQNLHQTGHPVRVDPLVLADQQRMLAGALEVPLSAGDGVPRLQLEDVMGQAADSREASARGSQDSPGTGSGAGSSLQFEKAGAGKAGAAARTRLGRRQSAGLLTSPRPRYDRSGVSDIASGSTSVVSEWVSAGAGQDSGVLPARVETPLLDTSLGTAAAAITPPSSAGARPLVASREVMAAFQTARERYARLHRNVG